MFECPVCGREQNLPGICENCESQITKGENIEKVIKAAVKELKKAYSYCTKALDERNFDPLYELQVSILEAKDLLEKITEGGKK